MELSRRQPRPCRIAEPLENPITSGVRQLILFSLSTCRSARRLDADQARLLKPSERHIDVAGVERFDERAECELKTRPQLIAVGGFAHEEGEQHLLHHAQLVALKTRASFVRSTCFPRIHITVISGMVRSSGRERL